MLLLAAFLLVSVNSLSAAERTRKCSAPLYLNIPNNGVIVKDSKVHIYVLLEKSTSVKTIEIVSTNGIIPTEVLTNFRNDGKVDVDIIIRGENFLPFLFPYASGPSASISIAEINYITVDNISGLFEANSSNPTEDISSRLVDMDIDGEGSNAEGIINDASVSTGVVSVNSVSSSIAMDKSKDSFSDNVTLYPNPISDNVLNLSFSQGNTTIQGVRVFNVVGSIVYQDLTNQSITGTYSVQLPNLPAGVYFVRIAAESNEVVKKFNITK
jgi:hypothetical protein